MNLNANRTRKVDTVEVSDLLADASFLAAALGKQTVEKDGRPAVSIDAQDGGRVEFTPPRTDLRGYDRLVVRFQTEGGPVKPRLNVLLGSRTRGFIHNDSFSSGNSPEVECPRWTTYPFPWENFLIFGTGELVYPVDAITLSLPAVREGGRAWVSEIRAEKRTRSPGPRLTDRGLQQAWKGNGTPDAVLRHLRSRTAPRQRFDELPEPGPDWTPETADDICRHFILGYDLGDPVDWRANPNGYLEWMHKLNRHGWITELLKAYRATGEPRYVKTLDNLWLSWLRDNPEPEGHNGGGDPAWETLSTAARIFDSWLHAFFSLLNDPHFRDATRIEILKSLHGHAEHLLAYQGYGNNWLVVESRALFMLGLLFPEFERAARWLEAGKQRLGREIGRQIFPDGADFELAPGYHMMASRGFIEPYDLATLNGEELPAIFKERLPGTLEYVAGVTRPDGTLPSFNDSNGWRGKRGSTKFLREGARIFNRPDLLQLPEGPYRGRSRAFPDAGVYVLAQGTGHEAFWSLFDCGPPGASHRHLDALNTEFFAFGLPFIVDPGITGYLKDAWTAYYRATEAHNTVLVNGSGQTTAAGATQESMTQSARGRVRSRFGETTDFVCASYAGPYAGQPDGVCHTRALLFVRGRYWVIFDDVEGEDAEEMEARFQFVPLRLSIDRRLRRFRTLRQDLPNMEIIVASPAKGTRLSVATGETDPVGGWVSDGEDVPAPQARIRLRRTAPDTPLRLAMMVYPFSQGVASGARIRRQTGSDTDTLNMRIRHADGTADRISYNWAARTATVQSG